MVMEIHGFHSRPPTNRTKMHLRRTAVKSMGASRGTTPVPRIGIQISGLMDSIGLGIHGSLLLQLKKIATIPTDGIDLS
jgi:hypothetical protein